MSVTLRRKQQSGMALITVLLVIALCFILVTDILTKQGVQVKRIQNLTQRQQAFWYAQGAEQFVRSLLEVIIDKDKGVINLSQEWATGDMAFPIDNGYIEGQLTDLNACLNLNALRLTGKQDDEKKNIKAIFVRYLESLELELESSESEIVENIADWMDDDDYPTEGLGYDGDMYTTLDFPYLTANSPMAALSELRLIYGVTPSLMEKVASELCVIPNSETLMVNVNTIDSEHTGILRALLAVDKDTAEAILNARPEEGFDDIEAFWQMNEMQFAEQNNTIDRSMFTVKSKFFKLISNALYNDVAFPLTSIMQLRNDNKIQIIARRFGGTIERKADTETEQSGR